MSRRSRLILLTVVVIIAVLGLAGGTVGIYTDWLWYGNLGFRSVYRTILITRVLLFVIFGVLMALLVGANLWVAWRLRPPFRPMSAEQQNLERYRSALEPRKWWLFGGVAVLSAIVAGSSAQNNWRVWQLFLHQHSFGVKDPQFHKDVSFYAFTYPVMRMVLGFLFVATIFSLLFAAAVHYLYGGLRLQTVGPKVTIAARRHLTVLVFFFIALKAMAYWLDRYGLVFSDRGKVTGAAYTDVNAALPAKTMLFWIAVIIAIGVLATLWLPSTQRAAQLPAVGFVVLLIFSILAGGIYPALVQQISVKPNASVKEAKYILRNIKATRAAYNINSASDGGPVNYVDYDGQPDEAAQSLTSTGNEATVGNIRLADPNVISPTYTQLQQLANYYGFPAKLDIDRYTLPDPEAKRDVTKDYIVGVRELLRGNLAGPQANWISAHTAYTHGYGFVAAAASVPPAQSGDFVERNIPPIGPIKITEPRVYFGEGMPDYSIVGAKGSPREFDGNDKSKITYTGSGGVRLSNPLTRLAFAVKFGQINFLLNDAVSARGARVIFDRDPREMVLKVAPFLKIDSDPYPAIVNGRVVWLLDGYTTMSNYPYAEKEQLSDLTQDSLSTSGRTAKQQDTTFNYIRNSVKITVDAYSGKVSLYQWDTKDPLLRAWMRVFPGVVQSRDAIPSGVLDHIRYPQDLFEVQRSLLERYHVDDPTTFYNASNQWTVPSDPNASGDQPPYYVLAAPPTGGADPEYQLTSPMRVNQKDQMAAYISVSAEGNTDDYGKMTVLRLPTDSQTFGPSQVVNQFKSNQTINNQLNLSDQGNSKVIFGNLLTLPIGGGFLYVEPVYVQSSQDGSGAYPLLQSVIVFYGNTIGYGKSLAAALDNLTKGGVGTSDSSGPNAPPSSSSSSPSSGSSPSGSPTTGSSGGSSVPPEQLSVDELLKQIDHAADELKSAYARGDYKAVGEWTAELKRLTDAYLKKRSPQSSPKTSR